MRSFFLYMTQPCAPSEQHPTIVGRIYPIQMHISENVHPPILCPKGTQTPPNLNIFCKQLWGVVHFVVCLCALRAQGWVMFIFLDMCLYWIYSANNYGVLFTWWGVCVPFGHRVGSCTTKGTTVISGGQVPGGQVPDLF